MFWVSKIYCIYTDHPTNNCSETAKHNMYTQTMSKNMRERKKKTVLGQQNILCTHRPHQKQLCSGTAKHNMHTQTMPQTMKTTTLG